MQFVLDLHDAGAINTPASEGGQGCTEAEQVCITPFYFGTKGSVQLYLLQRFVPHLLQADLDLSEQIKHSEKRFC